VQAICSAGTAPSTLAASCTVASIEKFNQSFSNAGTVTVQNAVITSVTVGNLITIAFSRGGNIYVPRLQEHNYLSLKYELHWSAIEGWGYVVSPVCTLMATHRGLEYW
jgi:hypothetical protein